MKPLRHEWKPCDWKFDVYRTLDGSVVVRYEDKDGGIGRATDFIESQLGAEILRLSTEVSRLSAWQPIETAPKDGSFFLGWREESRCPVVISRHNEESAQGFEYQPTHWMSLPDPPAVLVETSQEPKS